MKKLAATLAVVALLFSAGSAWADEKEGLSNRQKCMLSYMNNHPVPAFRECLSVAEKGQAWAQYYVGGMYSEGKGVPENDVEAVKWIRKAAEQGHVDAQVSLGFRYGTGEGVPTNFVKAYMWYSLAKARGDDTDDYSHTVASTNLDIIKKQMTPAQIAKAQALASEWWEEHN